MLGHVAFVKGYIPKQDPVGYATVLPDGANPSRSIRNNLMLFKNPLVRPKVSTSCRREPRMLVDAALWTKITRLGLDDRH